MSHLDDEITQKYERSN